MRRGGQAGRGGPGGERGGRGGAGLARLPGTPPRARLRLCRAPRGEAAERPLSALRRLGAARPLDPAAQHALHPAPRRTSKCARPSGSEGGRGELGPCPAAPDAAEGPRWKGCGGGRSGHASPRAASSEAPCPLWSSWVRNDRPSPLFGNHIGPPRPDSETGGILRLTWRNDMMGVNDCTNACLGLAGWAGGSRGQDS